MCCSRSRLNTTSRASWATRRGLADDIRLTCLRVVLIEVIENDLESLYSDLELQDNRHHCSRCKYAALRPLPSWHLIKNLNFRARLRPFSSKYLLSQFE